MMMCTRQKKGTTASEEYRVRQRGAIEAVMLCTASSDRRCDPRAIAGELDRLQGYWPALLERILERAAALPRDHYLEVLCWILAQGAPPSPASTILEVSSDDESLHYL